VRRPIQSFATPRNGPPSAAEAGAVETSQVDKDRLAAERASLERVSLEIWDLLRERVEFAYVQGMGFASELSLLDNEKEYLGQQQEGLVQAVVELERITSRITSAKLRYDVRHQIFNLFFFGTNITRFAAPIEAVERAHMLEEEARRTREAHVRGKASGASRQAKARTRWRNEALRLARQFRTKNPELSQSLSANITFECIAFAA
jgi:ABC-type uncharacterized transport system YnjBCD substrate-binding protein